MLSWIGFLRQKVMMYELFYYESYILIWNENEKDRILKQTDTSRKDKIK